MIVQAIWVTESQGEEGPVYGSSDRWKGIGVFLDTFDNDAKVSVFVCMHYCTSMYMVCLFNLVGEEHYCVGKLAKSAVLFGGRLNY